MAEQTQAPRVTLIDNYDSFTFNLVHYLGELGADVTVWRNDEITVDDVLAGKPDAIVLSPGPCTPNEAGICLELMREAQRDNADPGRLLGSPGHRQVYGGEVVRAPCPITARPRKFRTDRAGVFAASTGRSKRRAIIP